MFIREGISDIGTSLVQSGLVGWWNWLSVQHHHSSLTQRLDNGSSPRNTFTSMCMLKNFNLFLSQILIFLSPFHNNWKLRPRGLVCPIWIIWKSGDLDDLCPKCHWVWYRRPTPPMIDDWTTIKHNGHIPTYRLNTINGRHKETRLSWKLCSNSQHFDPSPVTQHSSSHLFSLQVLAQDYLVGESSSETPWSNDITCGWRWKNIGGWQVGRWTASKIP